MAEEGKKRRKAFMEKMLSDLREEKKEMIEKRENLKKDFK